MNVRTALGHDPHTLVPRVGIVLDDFLDRKIVTTPGHPGLPMPVNLLRDFLSGGKRLRPLLCPIGWQAGGGKGDPAAVLSPAASLEMFHAFALIHDDVMDAVPADNLIHAGEKREQDSRARTARRGSRVIHDLVD